MKFEPTYSQITYHLSFQIQTYIWKRCSLLRSYSFLFIQQGQKKTPNILCKTAEKRVLRQMQCFHHLKNITELLPSKNSKSTVFLQNPSKHRGIAVMETWLNCILWTTASFRPTQTQNCVSALKKKKTKRLTKPLHGENKSDTAVTIN